MRVSNGIMMKLSFKVVLEERYICYYPFWSVTLLPESAAL
jgi:hypothetical protein